jgi:putative heme iron utilization protein
MDPQPSASPWTLTSVLVIAISVLATVVAYLFKLYVGNNKDAVAKEAAMVSERASWAIERVRLAAEVEAKVAEAEASYEKRFRELIERYDDIARRKDEANRVHEDQVRKEFADIMERVATESGKSASALVEILQKFHDRFVGPRRH